MNHRGRHPVRTAAHLVLLALLLCAAAPPARAQEDKDFIPRAEVSEIKDMRRVLLIASRSLAVDIRGQVRRVFDEVFEGRAQARHKYAYEVISRRLEKFAREGRGLSAVETAEEAEFIIVFKVVTEHRSFVPDEPFVFGAMYVFLNKTPERPQPALVWRTKGDRQTPDDATREFIKALKDARGEK